MSTVIDENSIIPLTVQLYNGATDKTVKANVYRQDTTSGQTLNSAEITLTHVANGFYSDYSHTMTSVSPVSAVYRVFESDGSTPAANVQEYISESFQTPVLTSLTGSSIASAVWNATTTDYNATGTFGEHLQDLSNASANLSGASIASAVWDAALSSYTSQETFGLKVQEGPTEVEALIDTSLTVEALVDTSLTVTAIVEEG